jgi:hypothetical protein
MVPVGTVFTVAVLPLLEFWTPNQQRKGNSLSFCSNNDIWRNVFFQLCREDCCRVLDPMSTRRSRRTLQFRQGLLSPLATTWLG